MSISMIAASIMILAPGEYELYERADECIEVVDVSARLSTEERDRLFREAQFAARRMHESVNYAYRDALRIGNPDIRETTVAAIQGCIGGLAGGSAYSVVVGGCLGALAQIAGDSYRAFLDVERHIEEAAKYARKCEDCQERLWRDQ